MTDTTREAVARPPTPEALRELLREAIEVVHQTGSIRDHADPKDKTGWNVHGIETCADPLCVDALAALAPAAVAASADDLDRLREALAAVLDAHRQDVAKCSVGDWTPYGPNGTTWDWHLAGALAFAALAETKP